MKIFADKTFAAIEQVSEIFDKAVLFFVITLSIPLVVIILYAVFMRYVLNAAPPWSEEIARYLMVWVAMLAMSSAMKRGQHIGLTFLVERLGPRGQKAIRLFAYLPILGFFAVLFVKGIDMTIFVAPQRSPSADIPMWIPYMAVPMGGFLMVVQTVALIVRQIKTPVYRTTE
jgi:TRAP-type C4-dicarboxylate transport system permease small subunit